MLSGKWTRVLSLTVIIVAGAFMGVQLAQSQGGPERQFLIEEDLEIPGYEILVAEATLGVGEREGKHSHPGAMVGRMLEGEMTLEQDGKPTFVLKAGDVVFVEPGQVHEGINSGDVPVKAFVTFVVEKNKPLSAPAQ